MFRRSRLCGQHPSNFCNLTSIPPGQKQHYHQNVRRINQIAPPKKKTHTHTDIFVTLPNEFLSKQGKRTNFRTTEWKIRTNERRKYIKFKHNLEDTESNLTCIPSSRVGTTINAWTADLWALITENINSKYVSVFPEPV